MLPPPPPVAHRPKHQLLLVLDINGTLIDRLGRGAERSLANKNPLCPAAPDLTLNNHRVYLRPYLDAFFRFLFSNFHVAAWTSAMPQNSGPLVEYIFEPFGGAENLEFVWNRQHCIVEPTPDNPYNSVKDLRMIWKARDTVLAAHSHEKGNFEKTNERGIWNEHNTILIDDSASKSCRTPRNHLLVPTFSVGDLCLTRNCDEDTSLLSVQSYLEDLLADYDRYSHGGGHTKTSWSVQTFLQRNPLFIQTNSQLFLDARYIAYPLPHVRDGRHRAGVNRKLIEHAIGGIQAVNTGVDEGSAEKKIAKDKPNKKWKNFKRGQKGPGQVNCDSTDALERENTRKEADVDADGVDTDDAETVRRTRPE
ncbi:hypothetical protein HDU83_005371 [Entophlyctis luteolus]|nr:hypothetical protein HDU83_005371 [Entophlyctis luteolus]